MFDADGNPLQVATNGEVQEGSFSFQVAASAAGFFETGGSGALMSGSGQLTSNIPVGGTVLFGGDFGVAGVGVVRPLRNFLVPIEADPSSAASTGVALASTSDSEVEVTVQARRADGTLLPNGSVSVLLSPHGQLAQFPEQVFEGKEIDFSSFRGSLQVSSPEPIVGMAIRVSPGQFATLPVTSPTVESTTLYFAQFGDGEGVSSTLILVNPLEETATGTVKLMDGDGNPLQVAINGVVEEGSFEFEIAGRGVGFYATDGAGELVRGWVEVEADLPLGGTILFAGGFGVAGVGGVEAMARFLVPIESDAVGQIQTGVALANPNSSPLEVTLALRDGEGELVAGGSASLNLAPQGQLARFPEEIFQDIDLSNFRGTLEASAELPLVGMAIRVSPSEFATLPVTRMN